MTEAKVSIKFGDPYSQKNKSLFTITAQLQSHNIESHEKQLTAAIGKYRLPLIVVEVPQKLQSIKLDLMNSFLAEEAKEQKLLKNKKCYFMYELKNRELTIPIKKIQKLLKDMNTLNNSFFINLTFCNLTELSEDIKHKNKDIVSALLQNFSIQGKLDLDNNFANLLGQMISRISPGFSQSPLISFIQLFGGVQLQIQFQSSAILNEATRKDAFQNILEYKQPPTSEMNALLEQITTCEQEINLYIHFGKLGYIHLKGEARIWAHLLCII